MTQEDLRDCGLLDDSGAVPDTLQGADAGTETIDLESLPDAVTSSGRFDPAGVRKSSFGKLLETLPIPTFLIDRRLNIAFANQACSKIDDGYKETEGGPFCSLFANPSIGNDARSVLEKVFSSRTSQGYTAMLQISGSRIWGRMKFRPLRIEKHRFILVLVEDLTLEKKQLLLSWKHQEQLRKEKEDLRKSEEKYRNIIDAIQDGYYEVDTAGNFTFFNNNLCEITGYPRRQLKKMSYTDLMDEENAHKSSEEFSKVLSSDRPHKKIFDHEIIRKDGSKRNLDISISLIRDASGKPSGFRGICRDVTNRKRTANDVVKMEKLESIGVLAGGIAHDFNNILTSILGNIALAKMLMQSPDQLTRNLEEAEKGIYRARNLTQHLLTFSRGGSPVKKPTSISELVLDTCEFAVSGSNVRCEFSVPGDTYPVEVDTGQISQVISNLIINAKQAMTEGGVISVRFKNLSVHDEDGISLRQGKYVKLSIQDRGIGIPAAILPKIFDPYFTTKSQGSGLGLAAAHSIVKSHGGLITVESQPGLGTTFDVYLPASEKAMPELEHRDSSDRSLTTGEGNILLMDDEEPIRVMAREMLTLLGYDVDAAKDGEEAIELYRLAKNSDDPYNAVILDLTVPGGMGGKETLLKLVEIDPKVKAIVSSGYSDDPVMSDYKRYGFSGVVAKPYSAKELSWTLDSVIRGG